MGIFYRNHNYYNRPYDMQNYINYSNNSKSTHNTMNPSYIRDYGPEPFVVNIEDITQQNNYFRTALWTGNHLQITLMSIPVGESIGVEVHPNLDQFIRIEQGSGLVKMGNDKNNLNFQRKVYNNYAFVIPAGKWHNLINIGNVPIKLYSIYAPPQHPKGTVHYTKEDAEN